MPKGFKTLGSKKHDHMHEHWIELKKERFVPVKVYQVLGKLLKISEAAIERGIGKLFADGHLKPPSDKPRKSKKHREGRSGGRERLDPADFK